MYDKILGRVREGSGIDPNDYIQKVAGARNGNFPKFDNEGGLIDSYYGPESFPNRYEVQDVTNISTYICGALYTSDIVISPIHTPGSQILGTTWIVTKKNATTLCLSTMDQDSVTMVVYTYNGSTWSYSATYTHPFLAPITDVSPMNCYAWDDGNVTYYTVTDQDTQNPDVYYFNAGVFEQWQPTGNESFSITGGVLVYDDGAGNTTNYASTAQKAMDVCTLTANVFNKLSAILTGIVTFVLSATGLDNTVLNIYSWKFTTGATAPTVNWPAVSWSGGTPPTIEAETTYEINIADGIACWASTPAPSNN